MGTAPIRGGKSRVDDGSALGGPESVDEGWDDEPGLADTVDASSTVDELVVYLDGYLDAEARRRVEQRLLGDDDARAELAALQNSWDALDCLPATACSAEFTESTMKLVVQNELAAVKPGKWAQKTLLVLGLAAAAVISLAVGFFAAQSWQLAEERRFLEEFELIRDWEKYQLIGDFEFLLDLEREGLFAQEVSHEER
jgi:anti-sigma factor RsiW